MQVKRFEVSDQQKKTNLLIFEIFSLDNRVGFHLISHAIQKQLFWVRICAKFGDAGLFCATL